MTDIRKRIGRNGEVSYQVRYPTSANESGFGYETFSSIKEARYFIDHELPKLSILNVSQFISVSDAIQKWLNACEKVGRKGKDPVSPATLAGYEYRAEIMRKYPWKKHLQQLKPQDVVAFQSWLLMNYSRDLAKKVLSSFHSMILEMIAQGVLAYDPAAQITVHTSRYEEELKIPSIEEAKEILKSADELARDPDYMISMAWKRYRPMIYLLAETGLRPQELLVIRIDNIHETGIEVTQALDRSNRIGVVKTKNGRRFIPVSQETLKMLRQYIVSHGRPNPEKLVFPGEEGNHQTYNNFLHRCWYPLMERAKMEDTKTVKGKKVTKRRYTPYCLRHLFASMLIAANVDLKELQTLMGHAKASMTLDIYGHLIRLRDAKRKHQQSSVVSGILYG